MELRSLAPDAGDAAGETAYFIERGGARRVRRVESRAAGGEFVQVLG